MWAGESLPDSNNLLNLQLSDEQLVLEAVKRSFVLPPSGADMLCAPECGPLQNMAC